MTPWPLGGVARDVGGREREPSKMHQRGAMKVEEKLRGEKSRDCYSEEKVRRVQTASLSECGRVSTFVGTNGGTGQD